MEKGDTFYISKVPKDEKYKHLYGKKLTVGIVWCEKPPHEYTPVEEFCSIKEENISHYPPTIEYKYNDMTCLILKFFNGLVIGHLLIWLIRELYFN